MNKLISIPPQTFAQVDNEGKWKERNAVHQTINSDFKLANGFIRFNDFFTDFDFCFAV